MFLRWLKIKDQKILDDVFDASLLGLHLVTHTFVGLGIGYLLDWWLVSTKPWLTIIFLLCGIAAGFKIVYVEAMRLLVKADKYKKDIPPQTESEENKTRPDWDGDDWDGEDAKDKDSW